MADNEKSAPADIETASANNNNTTNILTPVLLLLAARRGFHTDNNFTQITFPDDYAICYRGKSGVEAVNHNPLIVRLACVVGYKPIPPTYVPSFPKHKNNTSKHPSVLFYTYGLGPS